MRRSKFDLRVPRSFSDLIIVVISSAKAWLVESGRVLWRRRKNGSTVRTKMDPESGHPFIIPDIIW